MKLLRAFKNLNKSTKLLIAGVLALSVIALPAISSAGFGPDRKVYDFSNPDEREGAFDGPRFNSYINTNVYGDERAFLDTKECVVNGPECYSQGESGGYKDVNTVTPGKEYIVRAYVHNIANPSINGDNNDGIGVAEDTRIRFELPEGVANGFTTQARISSSNAIPNVVYDTAELVNDDQAFDIEYVPGSAYISNAAHPNGLQLSDNIVGSNGTLIGYDEMNGIFPGCFEYSAFVTIRVKVTSPDLDLQKTVSKVENPGKDDVSEQVTVNRGENVSWRIDYRNTGSTVAEDITIRDQIPEGLTLVPGSIKWFDANHPNGETLQDTALSSGGVNVGNYAVNGNGAIKFQTTVDQDVEECEITNVAFGRASNVPEQEDTARVIIGDCVVEEPVYSCDLLELKKLSARKYKFTTTATAAGGASVKQYVYDFGDGSDDKLTDSNMVEHTYAKDGTYTARVTVHFNVGDEVATDTNVNCTKSITIDQEKPEEPEVPTTLPSTGPADMIGIFAATTIAAGAAHRFVWSNRRGY